MKNIKIPFFLLFLSVFQLGCPGSTLPTEPKAHPLPPPSDTAQVAFSTPKHLWRPFGMGMLAATPFAATAGVLGTLAYQHHQAQTASLSIIPLSYSEEIFFSDNLYGTYGDPEPDDVVQPPFAVCTLFAFLHAFAYQQPDTIRNIIQNNPELKQFEVSVHTQTGIEQIHVPYTWLKPVFELSESNGPLWPVVLATSIVAHLANGNEQHFQAILESIRIKASHNGTSFWEAIEQVGGITPQQYAESKRLLSTTGQVAVKDVMFDFWHFFMGTPATIYRLPWDNPNSGNGKQVIDAFSTPEKAFQHIAEEIAAKKIITAYINWHGKTTYDVADDGTIQWRGLNNTEKANLREGRSLDAKTGLWNNHNYSVVDSGKEPYLRLYNPHGDESSVPRYENEVSMSDGTIFTLKNSEEIMVEKHGNESSGYFYIKTEDFLRIFYTVIIN